MSSPPSIFDLAFNPPPAHPSTLFPGLTGSRIAPPQTSHESSGPPRLSSPRLFRDFFYDSTGSGQQRQSNAPRLPLFREGSELNPVQLAGAIARTSRAVEGVQEAFQSRRDESGREVVDLTDSPPQAEAQTQTQGQQGSDATTGPSRSRGELTSDFLVTTTHPLDTSRRQSRSRGVNTLNDPIFGYYHTYSHDPDSPEEDHLDTLVRVRAARRAHNSANRWNQYPRTRNTEQDEREAVRRQRDNHAAWQRTQARARQLLENQHTPRSPSPTPSVSDSSSVSSTPSSSSSNMSKSNSSRPSRPTRISESPIEAIDLTAVDNESAVAATLARQREDAIAAQRPDSATENGRTILTAYKCPVCMETPINATTTVCGHLFCHQCIVETLQWSAKQREEQAVGHRKKNGMCPVCRKLLAIKDEPGSGRTLVPLEIRFMTKKREPADHDPKGKGKAKARDDDGVNEIGRRRKRVKREKLENTDDHLWGDFMNDDVA